MRHDAVKTVTLPSAQESDAMTTWADSEAVKEAFRHHPAGVAIITADAGSGPSALTATSVVSISMDPPLLVYSLSTLSSATTAIIAAESVVVHLLGEAALELAQLCATSGADRFEAKERWGRLDSGEPYFRDVAARLRCRPLAQIEAGTSRLVVAAVLGIHADPHERRRPLAYVNRTWHLLSESSRLS